MIKILITLTISLLLLTTPTTNANQDEDAGLLVNKFHLSFGSGISYSTTNDNMCCSFYSSSFYGTVEVNGVSQKYPLSSRDDLNFNGEISYRLNNKWQPGFGVYVIPSSTIQGLGDVNLLNDGPFEESEGTVYYLAMDYLLNPMKNLDYSRWEWSAGAGISYASFKMRGDMGTIYIAPTTYISEEWEFSKYKFGAVFRTTLDYYLQDETSLRLRFGANILPHIDIPERLFETRTLQQHRVNFSTYEVSLNLALHL